MGRLLFAEMNSAHAPAWRAVLAPRGVPVLTPPNGAVHPAEEVA